MLSLSGPEVVLTLKRRHCVALSPASLAWPVLACVLAWRLGSTLDVVFSGLGDVAEDLPFVSSLFVATDQWWRLVLLPLVACHVILTRAPTTRVLLEAARPMMDAVAVCP